MTNPSTGSRNQQGETPALLIACDLQKTFTTRGEPPVRVLHGISLRVAAGEMVAVVGPSGSGKSTLLYCLSGLEPVTSGSVRIAGRDLGHLSKTAMARLRRERIGFVFQDYNLIPSLSARENVALPLRLVGVRDSARVDDALAAVALTDHASRSPGALSGGQRQRVAIARVLAARPDVVFADEPTGALDLVAGKQVLQLLRATATGSRSVVMVTHDLEAAAQADRVLVLLDGRVHHELVAPSSDDVFNAVAAARAGS